MQNRKAIPVLMGITGIILFSAKAVMVKLAYQYDVDALSLLLFRMLFALPIYLIIAAFFLPKPTEGIQLKTNDYLWLVLFGFLGYYISSYLDFLGLQYIKASLERIILFVYPTLIILISRVFLKIEINKWQVVAIIVTYIGIIITFWEELSVSEGDQLWIGAGLVFTAAITYATYLVGSGWLIPRFGSVRFTTYAMIIACFFVLCHYGIQNERSLFSFEAPVYYYGMAMAVFATVLPSFLVSEAIKHIGASNFGIFGSIGPISTIVMASIFLDENITWLQILGTLVVIAGVMILARNKKQLVNAGGKTN